MFEIHRSLFAQREGSFFVNDRAVIFFNRNYFWVLFVTGIVCGGNNPCLFLDPYIYGGKFITVALLRFLHFDRNVGKHNLSGATVAALEIGCT